MKQNDSKDVPQQTYKALSTLHVFCITTVPLVSVLVVKEIDDYFGIQSPYKYISISLTLAALFAVNLALGRCASTRKILYKADEEHNYKALVLLWVVNWIVIHLIFRD